MELKSYLKEHTLLVVPNFLKEEVLLYLSTLDKLYDVKVYTQNELTEMLSFTYSLDTIIYLQEKYQFKEEVCRVYLDAMRYVNKIDDHPKLKMIYELKMELMNENLLTTIPFMEWIKNYSLVFYGFIELDSYLSMISETLQKDISVIFIPKEQPKEKELSIYAFDTILEEVVFVASEIVKLIHRGVRPNQIKLSNITEEYFPILPRTFKQFSIALANIEEVTLYSVPLIQDFLSKLKSTKDLERAYSIWKVEHQKKIEFPVLAEQLLSILEDFLLVNYSFSSWYLLLEKKLKNTKRKEVFHQDEIKTFDLLNEKAREDDYVFVLGMNQNVLPKLYKDEEFLSDDLKRSLNLPLTVDLNKQERKKLKYALFDLPNVTITYKLKSFFDEFYPSSFIDELPHVLYTNIDSKETLKYSHAYNRFMLAKSLDDYTKYGCISPLLKKLYPFYNLPYLTYQNQYQEIDLSSYLNKIDHKITLSYSSLNTFYQCAFHFYLTYILKLEPYQENFSNLLGNLYHYILSKMDQEDFDFEKEYQFFLKDKELSIMEKLLLRPLKNTLLSIMEIIKKQDELILYPNRLYEKKLFVDFPKSSIKKTFMGIIDKVIFKQQGLTTNIAIVDYKTGSPSISLKHMDFGFDLQLPSYLYLLKKSSLFSNDIEVTGFYLQKILPSSLKKSSLTLDQKMKELRWIGYTTSDLSRLEEFDKTYEQSELIQGIHLTKAGIFPKNAKVLSDGAMNDLVNLVDEKIMDAFEKIEKRDFLINPKVIDGKNQSCKFCPFQDICYVMEEDKVYYQTKGDESNGVDEGTTISN